MKRNGAFAAITIVLLGAASQIRTSPPLPEPARNPLTATIPAPEPRANIPGDGPCAAIRDFLDPQVADSTKEITCLPANKKIGFLIATVPDPVNTHLALTFDRALESLQRAMEDSGYSYARHYLPWDAEVSRGEADPEKREQQRAHRRRKESQPGVLLFRKASGNSNGKCAALYGKALGIFLVAESPTGGVNRQAFQNVMKYIGETEVGQAQYAECPVPVIGPSFSGALSSLFDAMDASKKTRSLDKAFRVITGTATSPAGWKDIREKGVNFHSVVHNDGAAVRFSYDLLRKVGQKSGPLAIISEDETSYGAAVSQLAGVQEKSGIDPILNIRFPREISRLRNAYSDHPGQPAAQKGNTPPQQNLPLNLREISEGHDSVPVFSRGQTPLSQDAVLLAIATTLRRERIRFAILAATDPLDAIFLAKSLKSTCPDIRLLQLSAELLFVTAASEAPLDGMLAVTTYPLFPRNQHWTHYQLDGNQPRRIQFASSDSQGTYNAARAQLLQDLGRVGARHADELLEYFAPGMGSPEPGSKTVPVQPPLWLTVLTRSGYWPVAMRPESNAASESDDRDVMQTWFRQVSGGESFRPDRLPRIFVLVYLLVFGACCAVALVICGSEFFGFWKTSRWPALLSVQLDSKDSFGRAIYLVITVLSLTSVYLLLAAPLWRLSKQPAQGRAFLFCLNASPVPLILVAAALLSMVKSVLPFHGHPNLAWNRCHDAWRSRHTIVLLIGVGVFIFACGAGRHVFWPAQDAFERGFFFAYRSLDLTNGVSPIVPFLFLTGAFCCWGWIHMRRLLLWYERRPVLPEIGPVLHPHKWSIVLEIAGRVDLAVQRPFIDWPWRVVGAGAAIAAMVVLLRDYLQTFELPAYDRAYCFLLALVVFILFLTWFRFLRIWWMLRAFLEQLERHPLRHAFSAMSPEPAWSPILQRAVLKRTYLLETRTVNTSLRIVGVLKGACPQEWRRMVDRLQIQVNEILYAAGRHLRITPAQRGDINDLLAAMTEPVVKFLQRKHWREGDSEALDAVAKSGGDELPLLADEFVAIPFVVYIRYVLLQLRNLITFPIVGFVLVVLSINSYPFQSHRVIGWVMTGVFLVIGYGIGTVFVQMDRDAILSRLTKTAPGEVNKLSLLRRLLTVGALPAITVLSTQFPSVSRFLFSWVQPTLEALR